MAQPNPYDRPKEPWPWWLKALIGASIAAVVLAVALAIFGSTTEVKAQSFNCRAISTPTEAMICDSRDLRRLDDQMEHVYGRALRRGDTTEREQRRWLRNRDACGGRETCIEAAYKRRLRELRY